MKPSDPMIKPFRERPRAVCLGLCRGIRYSDLGTTVDGLSYDACWRAGEPLIAFGVLQGRIHTGDIAEAALVDTFGLTVWRMRQYVRAVEGKLGSLRRFDLPFLRDEAEGRYNLILRVNGRLSGKVNVRLESARS